MNDNYKKGISIGLLSAAAYLTIMDYPSGPCDGYGSTEARALSFTASAGMTIGHSGYSGYEAPAYDLSMARPNRPGLHADFNRIAISFGDKQLPE